MTSLIPTRVMEEMLTEALPSPWSYGTMWDGRIFFINEELHTTTWLHPVYNHPVQAGNYYNQNLPDGWETNMTLSNVPFYIDHTSCQTTFQCPTSETNSVNQAGDRKASRFQRSNSKRKSGKQKVVDKMASVKRNEEAPVSIRGWLSRQEVSGPLRSWKKRWCVLADFCMFFYKGSDETQEVGGSLLLPSFAIKPCLKDEDGISKKFSFKAEHENVKTKYFFADSQEEMDMWMDMMKSAANVQFQSVEDNDVRFVRSQSQNNINVSKSRTTSESQMSPELKDAESEFELGRYRSRQNSMPSGMDKIRHDQPDTSLPMEIKDGRVGGSGMKEDRLGSSGMTENRLGPISINENRLGPSGMTENRLGPSGMTENRLGPSSMTENRLGPNGMTENRLGPSSMTENRLGLSGMTENRLGPKGMTENRLQQSSMNENRLGLSGMTENRLGPNGMTENRLQQSSMNENRLGPGGMTENRLQPSSMTENRLGPTRMNENRLGPSGMKENHLGPSGMTENRLVPNGMKENRLGSIGINEGHLGPSGINEGHLGPDGMNKSRLGPSGHPEPNLHRSSFRNEPEKNAGNIISTEIVKDSFDAREQNAPSFHSRNENSSRNYGNSSAFAPLFTDVTQDGWTPGKPSSSDTFKNDAGPRSSAFRGIQPSFVGQTDQKLNLNSLTSEDRRSDEKSSKDNEKTLDSFHNRTSMRNVGETVENSKGGVATHGKITNDTLADGRITGENSSKSAGAEFLKYHQSPARDLVLDSKVRTENDRGRQTIGPYVTDENLSGRSSDQRDRRYDKTAPIEVNEFSVKQLGHLREMSPLSRVEEWTMDQLRQQQQQQMKMSVGANLSQPAPDVYTTQKSSSHLHAKPEFQPLGDGPPVPNKSWLEDASARRAVPSGSQQLSAGHISLSPAKVSLPPGSNDDIIKQSQDATSQGKQLLRHGRPPGNEGEAVAGRRLDRQENRDLAVHPLMTSSQTDLTYPEQSRASQFGHGIPPNQTKTDEKPGENLTSFEEIGRHLMEHVKLCRTICNKSNQQLAINELVGSLIELRRSQTKLEESRYWLLGEIHQQFGRPARSSLLHEKLVELEQEINRTVPIIADLDSRLTTMRSVEPDNVGTNKDAVFDRTSKSVIPKNTFAFEKDPLPSNVVAPSSSGAAPETVTDEELEKKLQDIYMLQRKKEEETFFANNLREEKMRLEKALSKLHFNEELERDATQLTRLRQQKQAIDKEMYSLQNKLTYAVRNSEETKNRTAQLEQEVMLLRKRKYEMSNPSAKATQAVSATTVVKSQENKLLQKSMNLESGSTSDDTTTYLETDLDTGRVRDLDPRKDGREINGLFRVDLRRSTRDDFGSKESCDLGKAREEVRVKGDRSFGTGNERGYLGGSGSSNRLPFQTGITGSDPPSKSEMIHGGRSDTASSSGRESVRGGGKTADSSSKDGSEKMRESRSTPNVLRGEGRGQVEGRRLPDTMYADVVRRQGDAGTRSAGNQHTNQHPHSLGSSEKSGLQYPSADQGQLGVQMRDERGTSTTGRTHQSLHSDHLAASEDRNRNRISGGAYDQHLTKGATMPSFQDRRVVESGTTSSQGASRSDAEMSRSSEDSKRPPGVSSQHHHDDQGVVGNRYANPVKPPRMLDNGRSPTTAAATANYRFRADDAVGSRNEAYDVWEMKRRQTENTRMKDNSSSSLSSNEHSYSHGRKPRSKSLSRDDNTRPEQDNFSSNDYDRRLRQMSPRSQVSTTTFLRCLLS